MAVENNTTQVGRIDRISMFHSICMASATAVLGASVAFIVAHTSCSSHTDNSYSCIGGKSEPA